MAGLFRVVGKKQEKKIQEKDNMNALDTSKFAVTHLRDWSKEKVEFIYITEILTFLTLLIYKKM